MKLQVRGRPLHLGYCSNIHPGESWPETRENLRLGAAAVKALALPNAPFGLGLRLSARAATELASTPGELEQLKHELATRGMYVFTINGFPHGQFHGARVKEQVYLPDWRDEERVRYTGELARLLVALSPTVEGLSISTVPVGFRATLQGEHAPEVAIENLLAAAAELFALREQTGAEVVLALEPEPACYLETTAEAIAFFERELWSRARLGRFAALTGLSASAAEPTLRALLGICVDTCHAAVEFEEPRETVRALERAGLRIGKVQATCGLELDPRSAAAREALARFQDPVYLHQVVAERRLDDGSVALERFVDLDRAFFALAEEPAGHQRWRVHYHVPVFARSLPPLESTQEFLSAALHELLVRGLCSQVEVETYTWSVLPDEHRALPLPEMIASELAWVRARVGEADRSDA